MNTDYQIGIISASVTVIVAIIGLFGNWFLANQNRKRELLIKEKEIAQQEIKFVLENLKSFWEYQNSVFQRVLKTVSILTFNEEIKSEEFLNAYKRLWEIKYGELPTCDAEEIEIALDEFASIAYEKKRLDPEDSLEINNYKKKMKPYLTNVSKAIRDSSILLDYSQKMKENILSR
ncbi:MAG: hypothetical protein AAF696_38585 [Bacteroidota bacterium]